VCRQFVALCREIDLFDGSGIAIDGSKFVLAEPSFVLTQ